MGGCCESLLAGTRSVISLTAGMAHLNLWKTVLNSLLSSMLWNGILIGAGWVIKENWQVIGSYLSTYGKVILVGISIFIGVVYFVRFKSKNRRAKKIHQSEIFVAENVDNFSIYGYFLSLSQKPV